MYNFLNNKIVLYLSLLDAKFFIAYQTPKINFIMLYDEFS